MHRWRLLRVVGREVSGLHQAAYVLAGFALCSQVLALVRDRLLAGQFGAGYELDLYYAAFRLPDILFALFASLLSLYALLPVLSKLEDVHESEIISFLRHALLAFFIVMGAVSAVVWLFVPALVQAMMPSVMSPELVSLVRILLLQPILLGASNILAALTQLRNRFVLYSLSPLLYNLGIIAGIVFLYPRFGITGIGWGVVLGALLHLSTQLPYFFSEKSTGSTSFLASAKTLLAVLALSIPRTLTLSAGQLTLLVLVGIASRFQTGSVAVFMLAYNLQAVPLTIIGVSYSVAAFPTLSRMYAKGERSAFVAHIESALRHIVFWSVLCTVFTIALRAQIVRVLFGVGVFDWTATRLTAAALALFVFSLLAQSASMLITRAYYASGKTMRPLYMSFVNVGVSVASAFLFIALFRHYDTARFFVEILLRVDDVPGTEVLALALGYSVGSGVAFMLGLVWFVRDFGISVRSVTRLFFEVFSASVIGGAVIYTILSVVSVLVDINTVVGILLQGISAGVTGLLASAIVLAWLGNQEFREVRSAIHRRVSYSTATVEPTDIAS